MTRVRLVCVTQWWRLLLVTAAVIALGWSWILLGQPKDEHVQATGDSSVLVTPQGYSGSAPSTTAGPDNQEQIAVDVSGAVGQPGVYWLPAQSRLSAALAAAGGASTVADQMYVQFYLNQASQLQDGQKVIVPFADARQNPEGMVLSSAGPPTAVNPVLQGNQSSTQQSSLLAAAPSQKSLMSAANKSVISSGDNGGSSLESSGRNDTTDPTETDLGKVSLNQATPEELEQLTGIGPARSAAIIAGRPYSSLEELVERRILTSSVFNQLKDQITP